MIVNRIRGFLICQPKPARIEVIVDGEPQELKVQNRSYQKLAETIAAMDAESLKCFDAEGKVLRVMRLEDEDARRSDAAEIPAALATDPETARLTHFANLIHRAYEHSTEVAFNKMVEVFDRINDRSAGIEARLERAEAYSRRLRDEQVEDAFERAAEIAEAAGQGGNDAFMNQMAEAFLSGRLQRKTNGASKPSAANGASNGKAKGGES